MKIEPYFIVGAIAFMLVVTVLIMWYDDRPWPVPTARVVKMSIVAALYTAFTIVLAPISFGPLQFRAANLLVALMFFSPDYAFGIALGCFFGNLASPFGALDWAVMPVITLLGTMVGYWLRGNFYLGVIAWALITSAGVSLFPLGMGAGVPFLQTFPLVLIPQLIAGFMGYAMFRGAEHALLPRRA